MNSTLMQTLVKNVVYPSTPLVVTSEPMRRNYVSEDREEMERPERRLFIMADGSLAMSREEAGISS